MGCAKMEVCLVCFNCAKVLKNDFPIFRPTNRKKICVLVTFLLLRQSIMTKAVSRRKRLLDRPVSEAESLTIMSGARQHDSRYDAHVVAESSHPVHS